METVATNNNENGDVAPPPVFQDSSAFGVAFEKRLAEIRAVDETAYPALNVDLHSVVALILGALPQVRKLRDDLAKLPDLNMGFVDGLEEYAEAAAEANSRFVTATTPEEDIVALNEEGMKLREILHSDALALATRGLLDRTRLKSFEGLTGYKNVGFDLIDWANLMRESWASIEGKTALTPEEIQHAKEVGERMVRAAAIRDASPAVVGDVARVRQQALALLLNAYDEVRRGISFLRWREDDVEKIAPSPYPGRGPGSKTSAGAAKPQPPAPAPNPAPAVGAGSEHGVAPATVPVAATGLPGAAPFAKA